MPESRRRHTDHDVRIVVDPQAASDNRWIAAEPASPETVADDDDRRDPRGVIAGSEKPSELGAGAEHLEVGRAGEHGLDPLGLRCAGQVRRDHPDPDDVLEQIGTVAIVGTVRGRESGVRDAQPLQIRAIGTRWSACGYGSGRRTTFSTIVKIAVVAAIARASVMDGNASEAWRRSEAARAHPQVPDHVSHHGVRAGGLRAVCQESNAVSGACRTIERWDVSACGTVVFVADDDEGRGRDKFQKLPPILQSGWQFLKLIPTPSLVPRPFATSCSAPRGPDGPRRARVGPRPTRRDKDSTRGSPC